MVDPSGVAEADGGDQLLEILASDLLLEAAFGDLIEELSAPDVLHDEVDLSLGGHDFKQLNDVGMANAAEYGDLALDMCDQTAFEDLLLVDDFDGHALVGSDVPGVVDLGECPMPQKLPDLVPPQKQRLVLPVLPFACVLLALPVCHG